MRLASYVVSLPLLLGAVNVLHPVSLARAATLSPVEATQLLAKANALNVKCSLLAEDQSQNLRDLLARAEISLAEKVNVAAARKAIAAGRAQGKSGNCDDTARALVNEVYSAASTAVSLPAEQVVQAEPPEPAVVPLPEEQQPPQQALAVPDEPAPKKTVSDKPLKPKAKIAATPKPVKVKQGLGSYAAVAEEYYGALKCGNVSAGKLNRMYKTVLAEHQSAMASNRARDVRAMLRAAEARAGSKSCG